MNSILPLCYCVIFGRGDASESLDYEIELTDEEEECYQDALEKHLPLEDVDGLQSALDRAAEEIEEMETSNYIGMDSYVDELQGFVPVSAEEVNRLVRERDPYTLHFFELEGLSDAELDAWDAETLDELPDVIDFDEDFEPSSPFDGGWTLSLSFCEPEYDEEYYDEEEDEEASEEEA